MADEQNPNEFSVGLGKMALTDEQANQIQNEIARVAAEQVAKMISPADKAALKELPLFGKFGRWGSFNRIIIVEEA